MISPGRSSVLREAIKEFSMYSTFNMIFSQSNTVSKNPTMEHRDNIASLIFPKFDQVQKSQSLRIISHKKIRRKAAGANVLK